MPKTYPPGKLVMEWMQVIQNFVREGNTLLDSRKRLVARLFWARTRTAFLFFYGRTTWEGKDSLRLRVDGKEMNFAIRSHDLFFYDQATARQLFTDAWWIVENYFRNGRREKIAPILRNHFGTIPPAINTLRMLKNCFHNAGIHTGLGEDEYARYKIRGWVFEFKKGKPIKNYHLAAAVQVVDEAMIEIINS